MSIVDVEFPRLNAENDGIFNFINVAFPTELGRND